MPLRKLIGYRKKIFFLFSVQCHSFLDSDERTRPPLRTMTTTAQSTESSHDGSGYTGFGKSAWTQEGISAASRLLMSCHLHWRSESQGFLKELLFPEEGILCEGAYSSAPGGCLCHQIGSPSSCQCRPFGASRYTRGKTSIRRGIRGPQFRAITHPRSTSKMDPFCAVTDEEIPQPMHHGIGTSDGSFVVWSMLGVQPSKNSSF